jgi:hypothetical protein
VEVASPPAAGLLRAAIERRLAGGAFPSGPEDAVGQAVARAVRESQGKEQRWH